MCVPVHECARGRVGATAIRSRTQLDYHKRYTHVSDQLKDPTSSYSNSFWAEVVVWTAPSFEEREREGETKITYARHEDYTSITTMITFRREVKSRRPPM